MSDLSVGLGWGWKSPFSSEDGGGKEAKGMRSFTYGVWSHLELLFCLLLCISFVLIPG